MLLLLLATPLYVQVFENINDKYRISAYTRVTAAKRTAVLNRTRYFCLCTNFTISDVFAILCSFTKRHTE